MSRKTEIVTSPTGDPVTFVLDACYWVPESPFVFINYDFGGNVRKYHLAKAKPSWQRFVEIGEYILDDELYFDAGYAERKADEIKERLDEISVHNLEWMSTFNSEYVDCFRRAIEDVIVKPMNNSPSADFTVQQTWSETNPYVVGVAWDGMLLDETGSSEALHAYIQHVIDVSKPYLHINDVNITPDLGWYHDKEIHKIACDYVSYHCDRVPYL